MTATQVISRYLKERGLYTKYFPAIKQIYLKIKRSSDNFYGYGFLHDLVISKDFDDNKFFIDAIMAYTGLRIFDVVYYIPHYALSNYSEREKLRSDLYKYAIAKLTKNQLKAISLFGKKAGFLTYEYKDNAWEK
jgi:hypothetical protein